MTDINYNLTRSDIFKLICGEELKFNSDNDFLITTFKVVNEEDKKLLIKIFNKGVQNEN